MVDDGWWRLPNLAYCLGVAKKYGHFGEDGKFFLGVHGWEKLFQCHLQSVGLMDRSVNPKTQDLSTLKEEAQKRKAGSAGA
jgi:hypothetical protein